MRLSDLVRSGSQRRPPAPREGREPPPRWTAVTREAEPHAPAVFAPRLPGHAEAFDAANLVFKRAADRVRAILAVTTEPPTSLVPAEEAVEILLKSLAASDALLVPFFRTGITVASPERGAVSVCILSVKIGLELAYPLAHLRELGLAALLCDIGTVLVPEEILDKMEPFTPDERAVLEQKQSDGAAVLEPLLPGYGWLPEVIRRRYDKSRGRREVEDRLDEYAAIIHLADIYKSLIQPRASRRRVGPLDALREILERHRPLFTDRLLKALVRGLGTYPVGSLVRLNTDEVARVVARNRDYPLRPTVELLTHRGRTLATSTVLDLAQNPLIHIKDSALDESDLAERSP